MRHACHIDMPIHGVAIALLTLLLAVLAWPRACWADGEVYDFYENISYVNENGVTVTRRVATVHDRDEFYDYCDHHNDHSGWLALSFCYLTDYYAAMHLGPLADASGSVHIIIDGDCECLYLEDYKVENWFFYGDNLHITNQGHSVGIGASKSINLYNKKLVFSSKNGPLVGLRAPTINIGGCEIDMRVQSAGIVASQSLVIKNRGEVASQVVVRDGGDAHPASAAIEGPTTLSGGSVEVNVVGTGIEGDLLVKGGTLEVTATSAGVRAPHDVTIEGGYVAAYSKNGAGITAGDDVVIRDGIVHSHSDNAAGIGGENITIDGGSVVAASINGAGIGGNANEDDAARSVTINGGDVLAGSAYGAGIGGGEGGHGGSVTINGGTVRITGIDDGMSGDTPISHGAGIGGGMNSTGFGVSIVGGSIQMLEPNTPIGMSGVFAADIGGAALGDGVGGAGGSVSITGGSIDVQSKGGGAGVGGAEGGGACEVSISQGDGEAPTVKAAALSGAGIGGGSNGPQGTVSIAAGTVAATSESGAGIGGGRGDSQGGVININNASVTAQSTAGGAGIGGGLTGVSCTVNIGSGTVEAQAVSGMNAQAIGCGGFMSDPGILVLPSECAVKVNRGSSWEYAVVTPQADGRVGACREGHVIIETCDHVGKGEHARMTESDADHDVHCSGCGAFLRTEGHQLSDNLEHDDGGHWHPCLLCGYRGSFAGHDLVIQHTGLEHWSLCQTCGYQTSPQQHDFVMHYDLRNHWTECSVCGLATDHEKHSGGTSASPKCKVCGCEYYTKSYYTVTIPATVAVGGQTKYVQAKDVYISPEDEHHGRILMVTTYDTRVTLANERDPSLTCTALVKFDTIRCMSGDSEPHAINLSIEGPDPQPGHYTGTMTFQVWQLGT